ncbi:MAG: tRNA 2-thiouridine(34) synthase MnmA [Syntrophobacterales bacterium]|nr:tRNA 2-thiouridine(34) synthase MnmA [Syntrophobacterales bacterium]
MMKKVLVAMSGGVDSSVAALLLKEGGYDVTGMTMCLGVADGGDSEQAKCCGSTAIEDARGICARLGIPHYVLDYSAHLADKVIRKFVSEYSRGRTPNPCIDCNRYLKFGKLLATARSSGFDFLATGHYAEIGREGETYFLKRPRDRMKDQTYFLYPIAPEALPSILFPLAPFAKDEVRMMARKADLPVAEKAESQDICFVKQKNYHFFFEGKGLISKPGAIVNLAGEKLGEHRGVPFYTIGQRSGLGISSSSPLYVVSLDVQSNRVVVGEKKDLYAKGLIAGDLNILVGGGHLPPVAEAKIRYRKKAARCALFLHEDKLKVIFEEAQESITPGQAVVCYQDDRVLAGGVIEEALYGIN